MVETLGNPALILSRRGAIAGLGAAGVGVAMAERLGDSRPLAGGSLYKIVYDDREAEGRAFGARFAAAGFAAATVGDDPTWLWFDDLHHHWRGAGVAGLTTPAVALSMKLMAELAGLRAVIWGRHRIGVRGTAHVVAATGPALATWKRQADTGAAWTQALHGMILTAAAQPAASPRFTHAIGAREGGAREMVSWLLAPISKGSA
jgi:hypothetical protein